MNTPIVPNVETQQQYEARVSASESQYARDVASRELWLAGEREQARAWDIGWGE